MPQTEAQRKASERNLRKGNERAYTRKQAAPADAQEPPEEEQTGPRTVRARAAPAAKPAKKARKAPAREPAAEPAKPRGGGFLGGLLDGIRGG